MIHKNFQQNSLNLNHCVCLPFLVIYMLYHVMYIPFWKRGMNICISTIKFSFLPFEFVEYAVNYEREHGAHKPNQKTHKYNQGSRMYKNVCCCGKSSSGHIQLINTLFLLLWVAFINKNKNIVYFYFGENCSTMKINWQNLQNYMKIWNIQKCPSLNSRKAIKSNINNIF